LKLNIQTKRLASGRSYIETEQSNPSPRESDTGHLTHEDEERRRRRRERNKVAATKCRHRKKERTVVLMQESDVLTDENVFLRTQIQKLETEKRHLMESLAMHSASCLKSGARNHTPANCDEYMAELSSGQSSQYVPNSTSHLAPSYSTDFNSSSAQISSLNYYNCQASSASHHSMAPQPVTSAGASSAPSGSHLTDLNVPPCLTYSDSNGPVTSSSPYTNSYDADNCAQNTYR